MFTEQDISKDKVELLCIRSGCTEKPFSVCESHRRSFLHAYSLNFKVCCNPYRNHSDLVKGRLEEITLARYKQWLPLNLTFLPGQKLCYNCARAVKKAASDAVQNYEGGGGDDDGGNDPLTEVARKWSTQSTQTELPLDDQCTQTMPTELDHKFTQTVATESMVTVDCLRTRSVPKSATASRTASHGSSCDGSPMTLSGQSTQSDHSWKSEEILDALNEILKQLNIPTVEVKKLRHQRYYGMAKLEEITDAIKNVMIQAAEKQHDYLDFSLRAVSVNPSNLFVCFGSSKY